MNAADDMIGKIVAVSIRVLSAAIFSWFVTGILLIPFNYYDIHAAQDNPSEIVYCPVTGLVEDARKSCVYYEFSGSTHIVYGVSGSSKLMREIYLKGNYKEYQLRLTMKKALFGSYFLEDLNAYTFHISPYGLALLGTIFIGLTFALQLWFTERINRAANRFFTRPF